MKNDICYHLNNILVGQKVCAINTAIEATTLADRQDDLLPQDIFIRDNIRVNDTLIISIGGNDIALRPSLKTILNMACLLYLNSADIIKSGPDNTWGMSHFIHMFKNQIKDYIEKLTSKTKPSKNLICTIYYPDEQSGSSWADRVLRYIGYDADPTKLQICIDQIHKYAISQIQIDGAETIHVPLYKILDGKNPYDYVQRMEPSDSGGQKIATELINKMK